MSGARNGSLSIQQELAPAESRSMLDVESDRAIQQVQAAMVIAKKFPRDRKRSVQAILEACSAPALAEQAEYTYPRGDEVVAGPSIRLAEVLASAWGNMDSGIVVLTQSAKEATLMAYCWDLERNNIQKKIFNVGNWRDTKKGGYALKDARDIYENQANFGARRLRACILAQIPPDVIEQARDACRKTIQAAAKRMKPEERAAQILKGFEEFKVTREMLEARVGMPIEKLSEAKYFELRGMYQALKDGYAGVDSYFGSAKQDETKESRADSLNKRFSEPAQTTEPEDPTSFAAADAGPLPTQAPLFGQMREPQPEKKRRSIEELQEEIVAIGDKLGLDVPALEARAAKKFKKSAASLSVDELERFAAGLAEDLARQK